MPAFYLGRPKCPTCNREFSGKNIGHGEPDSSFVFRVFPYIKAEEVVAYWIEQLADPEFELRDQWLQVHDKQKFIENFDKNKNKSRKRVYYEEDRIRMNGLGYLWSDIDLHLK